MHQLCLLSQCRQFVKQIHHLELKTICFKRLFATTNCCKGYYHFTNVEQSTVTYESCTIHCGDLQSYDSCSLAALFCTSSVYFHQFPIIYGNAMNRNKHKRQNEFSDSNSSDVPTHSLYCNSNLLLSSNSKQFRRTETTQSEPRKRTDVHDDDIIYDGTIHQTKTPALVITILDDDPSLMAKSVYGKNNPIVDADGVEKLSVGCDFIHNVDNYLLENQHENSVIVDRVLLEQANKPSPIIDNTDELGQPFFILDPMPQGMLNSFSMGSRSVTTTSPSTDLKCGQKSRPEVVTVTSLRNNIETNVIYDGNFSEKNIRSEPVCLSVASSSKLLSAATDSHIRNNLQLFNRSTHQMASENCQVRAYHLNATHLTDSRIEKDIQTFKIESEADNSCHKRPNLQDGTSSPESFCEVVEEVSADVKNSVTFLSASKDSAPNSTASKPDPEIAKQRDLVSKIKSVPSVTSTSVLDDSNLRLHGKDFGNRCELDKLREWELTGLGRKVLLGNVKPTHYKQPPGKQKQNQFDSETMVFTLMSYNVLSQDLLEGNMNLYQNCINEYLKWPYRWEAFKCEVEQMDPDVLLLQEVHSGHYKSHFKPWFEKHGYSGHYKKRTKDKLDGCAIFYRMSKFSLLEWTSVEYHQPNASNILDRDNIALIVKLMTNDPKLPPVCFATTHLLYNPKRHDIKLAQLVLLLAELDRICYMTEEGNCPKYCPTIVSGDFNADPGTAILRFFMTGLLNFEKLTKKTLSFQQRSSDTIGCKLLPNCLGITGRCQHAVLAPNRQSERSMGPIFSLNDKRNLELSHIQLFHSERPVRPVFAIPSIVPDGQLHHMFNFRSVYDPCIGDGRRAVTTKHQMWTMVDYLAFSCLFNPYQSQAKDSPLKLLAHIPLLSEADAKYFGAIPSAISPSDHYPLAAKFCLSSNC